MTQLRASELPDRYDPDWFAPSVLNDPAAFASAYRELRAIARYLVRGEVYTPTLQATELVNQAFLKLYTSPTKLNDRQHLLAVLSRYMRQVLIDRARRRKTDKRSGIRVDLELAEAVGMRDDPPWHLVDEALDALSESQPVLARVFELHYFAGLSMVELGRVLDKSERTIKRYWRAARTIMSEELRDAIDRTSVP